MVAPRDDAASRLWWALKRYVVVSVLITAACVGLAVAIAPGPEGPTYRSAALVIASQLETIRPEHLPRMAEAIFSGGAVAEEAVMLEGLDIPARELIPDHAELEPIANTVLMRVVGYAEDPELAAQTANAVAEALTAELNKAGPGVGQFTIQERARIPLDPEPATTVPPALIGLIGGLLLAFGAVALAMVLRRPVLSGGEAAAAADAPMLGTVAVPRSLKKHAEPTAVVGLTAVIKQVYPGRQGVCAFVSLRRGRARCSQVAEVVTCGLARTGLVCFVPSPEPSGERVSKRLEKVEGVVVSADFLPGAALGDIPVVIDGPSTDALDVPQFLPPDSRTVLVVPEGAPRRTLDTAARQFLPGELTGLIFVPVSRRLARRRSGRPKGDTSTAERFPAPPDAVTRQSG